LEAPLPALVFVFLIGTTLGLLGGGGSILAVPAFVYLLGYEVKEAIAMSLAVMGMASLAGAAGHWRAGRVNVAIAIVFGGVAAVGTYGGAQLARFVHPAIQLVLLSLAMLAASALLLRAREGGPAGGVDVTSAHAGWRQAMLVAAEALGVGILTGLVGVGGGFLIGPSLVIAGGLPMGEAVGTSLMVIALNCAAGLLGYVGQVTIAWSDVALLTAATIPGTIAGATLVSVVAAGALRRAFAVGLALLAVYIFVRNAPVLAGILRVVGP
jgi:hypothetical protein